MADASGHIIETDRYTYTYLYTRIYFHIYVYMYILTSSGSLIAGRGIRVLLVRRPGPSCQRRGRGESFGEEIRCGSEVAGAQRHNSNLVWHPAPVGTLDRPPGRSDEGRCWDQRPRQGFSQRCLGMAVEPVSR